MMPTPSKIRELLTVYENLRNLIVKVNEIVDWINEYQPVEMPAVLYVEQTLDAAQKVQARVNINAAADSDLNDLQNALNDLDSAVELLSSNVSALSGTVSTLSGTVSTLSGTVSTLSGTVSTLSGTVSGISDAIEQLTSDLDEVSEQLSGALSSIAALQNTKLDKSSAYNRNLLDNGWFTVNQRGATSGTTYDGAYCVDRWLTSYGATAGTWSISNAIFTLSPVLGAIYLLQRFENPSFFNGKQMTASIMLDNGQILHGTITRINGTAQDFISGTTNIQLSLDNNNAFRITAISQSVSFKAVKLEIGSVSTLSNDSTPNYADELIRCRRYFWSSRGSSGAKFYSVCASNSQNTMDLIVWNSMRVKPALSVVGDKSKARYYHNGSFLTLANANIAANYGNTETVAINISNISLPANTVGLLELTCGEIDFQLSADL